MDEQRPSARRRFMKLCAAAVTSVSARPGLLSAAADQPARAYARARLVHPDGSALRVAQLGNASHVFHYPYVSTPCFLLDLGVPARGGDLQTKDGERYRWDGGVGPRRSVVAFSAICAHKMSHPARAVSFIDYRADRASFIGSDKRRRAREQVIYCCSEKSVYDARDGARVLGGPAPQPLAAVLLDYDPASDGLYATGVRGGDMFEPFFSAFRLRLELEHGTSDITAAVGPVAEVEPLASYCTTRVRC